MEALREELDAIALKPGDIIVDHLIGYVGILLRRDRRIDMVQDDVYFWEVRWSTPFPKDRKFPRKKPTKEMNIMGYLEEETLKLSILIGATEKYSAEDD